MFQDKRNFVAYENWDEHFTLIQNNRMKTNQKLNYIIFQSNFSSFSPENSPDRIKYSSSKSYAMTWYAKHDWKLKLTENFTANRI